MKDVNTGNEKSDCCNAPIEAVGQNDFIGSDDLCTMFYKCLRCSQACDQATPDHVPDTGKKVKPTENKASEETSNAQELASGKTPDTHLRDRIQFLEAGAEEHSRIQHELLNIVAPHLDFPRGKTINPDHCLGFLKTYLKDSISKGEVQTISNIITPAGFRDPELCFSQLAEVCDKLADLLTEGHSPEVDKPNKK